MTWRALVVWGCVQGCALPVGPGSDGGLVDGGAFWRARDGGDAHCPTNRLPAPEICTVGWILDDDTAGGPLIDGGFVSNAVGDNRCYQPCTRDDDCADPSRPFCSIRGRWRGGDYNCQGAVRVCSCEPVDECEFERP